MEREQFKVLVKAMKAVYAQPTFIPDQDAFNVWFALLGDLPYKQAELAVQKHMANYENLVKMAYQEKAKGKKFKDGDMLDVRIIAYYNIPPSTSKKRRTMMLEHKIRPTKKPDWDNIGKIVCDSLNNIAYHDDNQVVDAQVRKFFSENPRVEVTIRKVEG